MAYTILQTCWRAPGRKLDRKKVTARELAESKWKADYDKIVPKTDTIKVIYILNKCWNKINCGLFFILRLPMSGIGKRH